MQGFLGGLMLLNLTLGFRNRRHLLKNAAASISVGLVGLGVVELQAWNKYLVKLHMAHRYAEL